MTDRTDLPIDRSGMFAMTLNFLAARSIYVAAELGLADQFAKGQRTSAELAAATGTHEQSLYRLLRLLASVGVFRETAPRTFDSTPLSNSLRSDLPGSLRPFVLLTLGLQYQTWGRMIHTIKTGEPSFDDAMGTPHWQYLTDHPEANSLFNQVMSRESEAMTDELLATYDFSPFGTVVDVGGGEGALITAVLADNPGSRGVLFDQPHVVTTDLITRAGVADRCDVVGGDFFAEVPAGGNLYVLKWILHDWDDDQCLSVLSTVREAMTDDATLLIVEYVIPPGNEPAHSKILDMVMLVLFAGRERTREQFDALLASAGFRVERVRPVPSGVSLIEARPVA